MNDLITAIERYKLEPLKLTGADIALIRKSDPDLAERAVAARSAAQGDYLGGIVVTRVNEVMKAALERRDVRIKALEDRIVELEADRATRQRQEVE